MYGIYCGVESRNIIKFNLEPNCLKLVRKLRRQADSVTSLIKN